MITPRTSVRLSSLRELALVSSSITRLLRWIRSHPGLSLRLSLKWRDTQTRELQRAAKWISIGLDQGMTSTWSPKWTMDPDMANPDQLPKIQWWLETKEMQTPRWRILTICLHIWTPLTHSRRKIVFSIISPVSFPSELDQPLEIRWLAPGNSHQSSEKKNSTRFMQRFNVREQWKRSSRRS